MKQVNVKEVNLQYFDKKGRKLTIKEAYRQMCWKFHGKMPSHRKREKMEKKEETQSKVHSAHNALGSLGSLTVLKKPKKH